LTQTVAATAPDRPTRQPGSQKGHQPCPAAPTTFPGGTCRAPAETVPLIEPQTAVRALFLRELKGGKSLSGRDRAQGVDPGDGPLALQVHYRLGGRRNWATLWKPTIDALGHVIGVPEPRRPFGPNRCHRRMLRVTWVPKGATFGAWKVTDDSRRQSCPGTFNEQI